MHCSCPQAGSSYKWRKPGQDMIGQTLCLLCSPTLFLSAGIQSPWSHLRFLFQRRVLPFLMRRKSQIASFFFIRCHLTCDLCRSGEAVGGCGRYWAGGKAPWSTISLCLGSFWVQIYQMEIKVFCFKLLLDCLVIGTIKFGLFFCSARVAH